MKVSYITTYDATDVHNWSGLGHNIAKSLEQQGIEIDYVGNLKYKENAFLKLKGEVYKRLGKAFSLEREPSIAMQYACQVEAMIKQSTNIIFSPGSIPIALLQSKKPKVFYTDATFAGMLNFYDTDEFTNLSSETIKHANYLEQKALETSQLVLFASEWAAKTATEFYNVDPRKVKVVPFGANVKHNLLLDDIKELIQKRSKVECKLLFLGVEWERKGADLAIKVATTLNQLGLKTKLHMAGLQNLPVNNLPEYIINHGYISKSTEKGRNKINQLLLETHFLIVPSKAEAYGLVYCEANSFGVPAIATNVGGIPTIIKDDINGKKFDLATSEQEYATYIFDVFNDNLRYNELALSSFNEYSNRLNWKSAGETILNYLKDL